VAFGLDLDGRGSQHPPKRLVDSLRDAGCLDAVGQIGGEPEPKHVDAFGAADRPGRFRIEVFLGKHPELSVCSDGDVPPVAGFARADDVLDDAFVEQPARSGGLTEDVDDFAVAEPRLDGGSLIPQACPVTWRTWIRTVEIEPAIDASAAIANERGIEALLRCGCRILHLNGSSDNLVDTVGTLAPLVHRYDGVFDVHAPDGAFALLAAAGADSVSFDATARSDVAAAIAEARDANIQVGIAFDETTPADVVAAESSGADLVLCRVVGDGAVAHVRRVASSLPPDVVLQVEGAVTHDTVRPFYEAGARLLVTDEPIFGREDLPRAYRRLVQALA
jgi:ribulose-phosphate 3-epimerase